MFQKLRTVIYHVTELPTAKQWYADLLEKPPYFDQPFYVGFDVNGCELGLVPNESGVPRGAGVTTYWRVEDILDAHARLLRAGATALEAVQDVGDGIKVASVTDPWGNVVGVIQESTA